ncbi:DUF262 domain-containing protein [Streptococcus oriscaviae]|uniref:DUF262 domain-containing protein n=1 Tax=Streptococcus oriscaviae TaxID=2781599 RepID=A0ABX7YKY5_9STRE|nr:DUF262 domain-containing protein [Streptococcus oriscaviae]QUE54487.1 DUF262 domain-containing protein [Streptococcus oriscaviae]
MKQLRIEDVESWTEISEKVELTRNGAVIGYFSPTEPIITRNLKEILQSSTKYYIPSYQRGYRWTKKQVEDLLNDIWEWGENQEKFFHTAKSEKVLKYSLQPIVLKTHEGEKFDYDLVDGQQRLTTLFIIMKALREVNRDIPPVNYSLAYETRDRSVEGSIGSQQFLVNYLADKRKATENIDFFFMNQAYETAKDWFEEDEERKKKWFDHLTHPDYGAFLIVYNASQAGDNRSSEEIFSNLNAGKIPLVDSELVKGLFLKSSNFDESAAITSIVEISSEWDRIERKLRDKNFWAWLGQDETDQPRIDFILKIVAQEDDFYPFFAKKLKSGGQKNTSDTWLEIKKCFMTLEDWYDDLEIYHYIGYLNQVDFKTHAIRACVKEYHSGNLQFNEKIGIEKLLGNIDELTIDNSTEVRKLLLLFNILTCIKTKNQFRFDAYRATAYDIEHISPKSGFDNMGEKDRKEWLAEVRRSGLFNEQLEEVGEAVDENVATFNKLYSSLIDNERLGEDDIDSIGNLCLLDSETNRSYGNKPFPLKVQKIIEVDAMQDYNRYLLPTTKNVFLKYYSGLTINNFSWSQEDAEKYKLEIKALLEQFKGSTDENKVPDRKIT